MTQEAREALAAITTALEACPACEGRGWTAQRVSAEDWEQVQCECSAVTGPVYTALPVLRAAVERLEALEDVAFQRDHLGEKLNDAIDKEAALRERVAELERERDKWKDGCETNYRVSKDHAESADNYRLEGIDLRERLARCEAALRPFASFPSGGRHVDPDQPMDVTATSREIDAARAALADAAPEPDKEER